MAEWPGQWVPLVSSLPRGRGRYIYISHILGREPSASKLTT